MYKVIAEERAKWSAETQGQIRCRGILADPKLAVRLLNKCLHGGIPLTERIVITKAVIVFILLAGMALAAVAMQDRAHETSEARLAALSDTGWTS